MKTIRVVLLALVYLCFLNILALANGLNLNSLGSKALSMGGAFVGLADDFSAIYWNPAGMARFDRRCFGFYGMDVIPSGTYRNPPIDARTKRKHYLSGLAAYYLPVGEKAVVALAAYIPSGLGSTWNGDNFTSVTMGSSYLWISKIGLVTFAPGLAFKVNDQISAGAALNINYGTFSMKTHAGSTTNPLPPPSELDLGQYEESMTGWGYGATFGVLFKPMERLSMGATLRTSSTVKFSGEATISNLSLLGYNDTSDLEREVTWPMWAAAGVAFNPAKNLILTADLQWTQWSKIDTIKTTFKDVVWQAMMAQSGDDEKPMHWEDALQVRFGAEYRIKGIAFRGGYYFDPSPAPDKTMNILLPSYDFNVITLGFGYNIDDLHLDFSIEYMMGKDRNVPADKVATDPEWASAMPGTYTMKVIVPSLSISYKF
jgi:long-chain fatty acid transport protein